MLRSPKERFTSSAYSGAWGKVVNTELFEEAVHAAMSQFISESPMDCPVPQAACDAHQQSIGARKILDILCTLHIPNKPTSTIPQAGLDYQAGV